MPREQHPSHSKASTEADVPASESMSLFFGNGLKLSTDVRISIKERIADLPVMNERPLNLSVPKPLFARSHSHTAFGFQAMAILDTGHPQETMSDDVDNSMDKGADIANEGKAINGGT